MPRVERDFTDGQVATADEITNAFWCACHGGGQKDVAEYLLDRAAQLNWIGHDGRTPLDAANRSGAEEVAAWLRNKGAGSVTP